MSYYYTLPIVVDAELAEARKMLGTGMNRILGYYEEDGAKSITQIEQALAGENAAAMVIPAHTLKGESRQFGAKRLGDLSEVIEKAARKCVEQHLPPTEVASEIAMLRGCFAETLAVLKGTPSASPVFPTHQAQPAQPLMPPQPFQPAAARATPFASGPRTFGRRIG
ncbi:MAG: Hpt domain-containing protein [Sphingobium sp.]|nr:Hpt domain-containing protein [Sphingobium sp.]